MNIQNRYNEGYYRTFSKIASNPGIEKQAFNVRSLLRNMRDSTRDFVNNRYFIPEDAPWTPGRSDGSSPRPPVGGGSPGALPDSAEFAPEFVPGKKPNWANIATDAGIAGGAGLLATTLGGGSDEGGGHGGSQVAALPDVSTQSPSSANTILGYPKDKVVKGAAYTLAGLLVLSGLSRLFRPRRRRRYYED